MKKNIAISLLSAVAVCASANSISWSLEELDVSSYATDSANPQWQYVFLTGTPQQPAGNNAVDFYEQDGNTVSSQGTTANLDSTANYVLALWDGSSSKYYGFQDGSGNFLTVTVADFDMPGGTTPATFADQVAAGTVSKNGVSYTLSSTAVVPEPGTATLALAGLALLIRRRK